MKLPRSIVEPLLLDYARRLAADHFKMIQNVGSWYDTMFRVKVKASYCKFDKARKEYEKISGKEMETML